MKQKFFIIALLSLSTLFGFAQTNDSYSYLIDNAMESLRAGDCDAAQRFYNAYKELSGASKPSVQVLIDNCKEEKRVHERKKKPQIDLMDNSYCRANKNRYVAWNIAGAGYPWNLVTGIEFRGGGIVGVGLYGDIGMDFTTVYYKNDYYANGNHYTVHGNTIKTAFRYAGGVKLYPYKGLFIDFGYGTIATPTAEPMISVSYKSDLSPSDVAQKSVQNSHGILFHAGYNLVTNLSDGAGFFLGVSGGASYDVINKVVAPSVNLKFGIAWGWQK